MPPSLLSHLYVVKPTNPLFLAGLQLLISSAILGLTRPGSLARPAALALILACVFALVSTASQQIRPTWAAWIGGLWTVFALKYVDLALVSGWYFEEHGPKYGPTNVASKVDRSGQNKGTRASALNQHITIQHATIWQRLRFGWTSIFNFRHIDTPIETKNVPPFSNTNPAYIPPRRAFILQRTLTGALCYLIVDIIESQPPPENSDVLFDTARVPIFRRWGSVTTDEMILRVFSTLGFWLSVYCMIQAGCALTSAVAVALNASEVRDWRPMFGSISSIYTLRNFWGSFWHQGIRRILTTPASLITYDILHLREKNPLLARYLHLFLVFSLSGLIHYATSISLGVSPSETGVLAFFITQAVGITIEDAAQAFYKFMGGSDNATLVTRCVGYVWVVVFLIWSSPAWFYASAALPMPVGSGTLPVSVVRGLSGWMGK